MNYYPLNEIISCYRISNQTLKRKIKSGEIHSETYEYEGEKISVFRYFIPETELKKIKHLKIAEPTPCKYSPEEWSAMYREKERLALKNKKFIPYKKYIQTEEWRQKARQCYRNDNFHCQKCGTGINLEAHHLNYKHLGEAEEINDLITLCKTCHKETHKEDLRRKQQNYESRLDW